MKHLSYQLSLVELRVLGCVSCPVIFGSLGILLVTLSWPGPPSLWPQWSGGTTFLWGGQGAAGRCWRLWDLLEEGETASSRWLRVHSWWLLTHGASALTCPTEVKPHWCHPGSPVLSGCVEKNRGFLKLKLKHSFTIPKGRQWGGSSGFVCRWFWSLSLQISQLQMTHFSAENPS